MASKELILVGVLAVSRTWWLAESSSPVLDVPGNMTSTLAANQSGMFSSPSNFVTSASISNVPPSVTAVQTVQSASSVSIVAQPSSAVADRAQPSSSVPVDAQPSSSVPGVAQSSPRATVMFANMTICAIPGNITTTASVFTTPTRLAILNEGEIFNAAEGGTVNLRCVAFGPVMPTLSWERGGRRLESTKTEVLVVGKVVSGCLHLKDVKAENAGQYLCVARNGLEVVNGTLALIVSVNVKVEMNLTLEREFHEDLKNSSSQAFRKLEAEFVSELSTLWQNFTGFKRIEVLEFRNGSVDVAFRIIFDFEVKKPEEAPPVDVRVKAAEVLFVKMKETNGKIGSLTIKPGSVGADVEPSAPRNLTAVGIERTEIRLKWSPPELHEAHNVLHYIVEFKMFGGKWRHRNTDNKHVEIFRLTHLRAGTSYSLRVSAKNRHGVSLPSGIIRKRTMEGPGLLNWHILVITLAVIKVVLLLAVFYYRCRRRRVVISPAETSRPKEEAELATRRPNSAREDRNQESSGADDSTRRILRGTWREIPRHALVLGEKLGSGMFGQVVKAWVRRDSGEFQQCAVKTLKAGATEADYRDLANEVEIMSNVGQHPNLVNLIGVCSVEGLLYLVMEFAENGSLRDHLRQSRNESSTWLSNVDKFTIALGVARGMDHLSSMKCVHRDLAARNVLLGENMTPKVADFGLSRDVYERGFYQKTTAGKLPTRWMAIEALERMVFTSESDVWSFGVLIWEIETGGKLPYAGLDVKHLLQQLKSGYRLEQPNDCSDDMYDLMMWCWLEDPAKRPTFRELCSSLEACINSIDQGQTDQGLKA